MKREEHYCDRCGTKMTSVDVDGDVQGITVPEFHADVNMRTSYGSSGSRRQFSGREFCGWQCFSKALAAFSDSVEESVARLEKLNDSRTR